MMRSLLASLAMTALLVASPALAGERAAAKKEIPVSFYDLTVKTIDLADKPLGEWRGKVALVVNTASECGNTPQYAGLEKLWQEYRGRGLAVLGFPSNDFGGQEPGSEAEIKKFCSLKYHVSFPMFAKVKTKGDGQSAVYKFLTTGHDAPKWNFHKYLIGKDGQVRGTFADRVQPDDKQLRAAIEDALAQ